MIFNYTSLVPTVRQKVGFIFFALIGLITSCSWSKHISRYSSKSPEWKIERSEAIVTETQIDTINTVCNDVSYIHPRRSVQMIRILQCENGYSHSKRFWENGAVYCERKEYRQLNLNEFTQFPYMASTYYDRNGKPLRYTYWENRPDTTIEYYQLYDRDGNLEKTKYPMVYSVLEDKE
jgi:hypothetical protein